MKIYAVSSCFQTLIVGLFTVLSFSCVTVGPANSPSNEEIASLSIRQSPEMFQLQTNYQWWISEPSILGETERTKLGFSFDGFSEELFTMLGGEVDSNDGFIINSDLLESDYKDILSFRVLIDTRRYLNSAGDIFSGLTLGLVPMPLYDYRIAVTIEYFLSNERIGTDSLTANRTTIAWVPLMLFSPFVSDNASGLARMVAQRISNRVQSQIFQDAVSRVRVDSSSSPDHFGNWEPVQPDAQRVLISSGTAFAVRHDGLLLTNYHVVRDAVEVLVRIAGSTVPAVVLAYDSDIDLALLRVDETFDTVLLLSTVDSRIGQTVFTIGFPLPEIQGYEPKYTDGTISSLSGIQDDRRILQVSVPIQPGNSGGPLVNSDGDVVGIVVSRLDDSTIFSLPQNVNYAIKSTQALAFLLRNNFNVLQGATTLDTEPIELVEQSTFMIESYQMAESRKSIPTDG